AEGSLEMAGRGGMIPVRVDLPYLVTDPDRHGNVRLYVRRYGRKVRIRAVPGSPAFLDAYRKALESLGGRQPTDRAGGELETWPVRSLGWLAAKYFGSTEFQGLDETSQKKRRSQVEDCLRELYPCRDGSKEPIGRCPLDDCDAQKIKWLRDLKV